jgi:hypothetical protein
VVLTAALGVVWFLIPVLATVIGLLADPQTRSENGGLVFVWAIIFAVVFPIILPARYLGGEDCEDVSGRLPGPDNLFDPAVEASGEALGCGGMFGEHPCRGVGLGVARNLEGEHDRLWVFET